MIMNAPRSRSACLANLCLEKTWPGVVYFSVQCTKLRAISNWNGQLISLHAFCEMENVLHRRAAAAAASASQLESVLISAAPEAKMRDRTKANNSGIIIKI